MSITGNSDNIFVNNANLKIADVGKGVIFADGSVLYTANVFNTQNLLSNTYQFTNAQTAFVINEGTANTGFAGNTAPADAISVSSNLFISYTGNLTTFGQITAGSVANVESNILTLEAGLGLYESNVYLYNGNVGIANSAPGHALSVGDSFYVGSDGGAVASFLSGDGANVTNIVGSSTVKGVTHGGSTSVPTIQIDTDGKIAQIANTTIAQTLQAVTDNGNTTSNTVQFTGAGTSLITSGRAGIANSAPGHTLSVGSNVYFDDTGSNTLVTTANISAPYITSNGKFLSDTTDAAEGVYGGVIDDHSANIAIVTVGSDGRLDSVSNATFTVVETSDLDDVVSRGNATSSTVQFTGAGTSLITSGRVGISNSAPGHALSVGTRFYVDEGAASTNVAVVDGNVAASYYYGDGGFLSNISDLTSTTRGSASLVPQITFDANGRISSVAETAVQSNVDSATINQLAFYTSATQVAGFSALTKDGDNMTLAGDLQVEDITINGNLHVAGNTIVHDSVTINDPVLQVGNVNVAGTDAPVGMVFARTDANVAVAYKKSNDGQAASTLVFGYTSNNGAQSDVIINAGSTLPSKFYGTIDSTGAITTAAQFNGSGAGLSDIQLSNISDNFEANFTSNVSRIGTLETDVSSNAARIGTLETDLSSNAARVGTLETDLSSNAARIGTLETDLSSNAARIGTLETDLSSNAARIGTLETDLSSNAARIGTLETDLSSNAARIGTLETDLSSNAARIGTLETDLSDNSSRIGLYESNIHLEGYKVGVGTATPSANLHVVGDVYATGELNVSTIVVTSPTGTPSINAGVLAVDADSKSYSTQFLTFNQNITSFSFSNLINGAQVVLNLYNSNTSSHTVDPGAGTLTNFSGAGSITVPAGTNSLFVATSINGNLFVSGAVYDGVVYEIGDIVAFHYGSFGADVYGDGSIGAAANNGHIYDDTPTGTYSWGTLDSRSTGGGQTTYTWTPSQAIAADVLLVAGGGGGGSDRSGGGGAGGLVFSQGDNISGQQTVVVGNGGASLSTDEGVGNDGFNTVAFGYTATGGGGGGGVLNGVALVGNPGGSGGGGCGRSGGIAGGSSTQNSYSGKGFGNSGGTSASTGAGGGGGAGQVGQNGSGDNAGDGGTGRDYSGTFGATYGDSGWFAGGGGGGYDTRNSGSVGQGGQGGGGSGGNYGSTGGTLIGSILPVSGTSHTGGGGGGTGVDPIRTSDYGAAGGSGIVLVKRTA